MVLKGFSRVYITASVVQFFKSQDQHQGILMEGEEGMLLETAMIIDLSVNDLSSSTGPQNRPFIITELYK